MHLLQKKKEKESRKALEKIQTIYRYKDRTSLKNATTFSQRNNPYSDLKQQTIETEK